MPFFNPFEIGDHVPMIAQKHTGILRAGYSYCEVANDSAEAHYRKELQTSSLPIVITLIQHELARVNNGKVESDTHWEAEARIKCCNDLRVQLFGVAAMTIEEIEQHSVDCLFSAMG